MYESSVKLGGKYRDEQTGTEGIATAISFYQHGCSRVDLEWTDQSGVINAGPFDEPRLSGPEGDTYESDLILGEKYRDSQTKLEGILTVVTFFQHGCERGTLEYAHAGDLKTETFDAPRLESSDTGKKAQSARTGGPMRGSSHVRPGSVRRR